MYVIWQIGRAYERDDQRPCEFVGPPGPTRVFDYRVDQAPHSAEPRCPAILYKPGHEVPQGTAELNIHFTLAHRYRNRELTFVLGRFGTDVDHVALDGRRIGVVQGRGERVWMRWKRQLPALVEGEHVLTLTNVGGGEDHHRLDFIQLLGVRRNAVRPRNGSEPEPPLDEPKVSISHIHFRGAAPRTESDEFVEITNSGRGNADISGWRLDADDPGQQFVFPPSTTLPAGQTIRVYTNEIHPESGGYTFGSPRAVWNNRGDLGTLYDADGEVVSTYGYGSKASSR